jgi:hypothetical protein
MQKHHLFLVYKKERTHSVRQRNDEKKKASKIINNINDWHSKEFSDDEESSVLLTMEDFLNGLFPWQISEKKAICHQRNRQQFIVIH